jgi:hypothetical protein
MANKAVIGITMGIVVIVIGAAALASNWNNVQKVQHLHAISVFEATRRQNTPLAKYCTANPSSGACRSPSSADVANLGIAETKKLKQEMKAEQNKTKRNDLLTELFALQDQPVSKHNCDLIREIHAELGMIHQDSTACQLENRIAGK